MNAKEELTKHIASVTEKTYPTYDEVKVCANILIRQPSVEEVINLYSDIDTKIDFIIEKNKELYRRLSEQ